MLAAAQRARPLAVLHVVAEELVRQQGTRPKGRTYFLASRSESAERRRFLGRPLRFQESELFDRPEGLWRRWDDELEEPGRTVVIENTDHGFAPPERGEAITESARWLEQHLLGRTR